MDTFLAKLPANWSEYFPKGTVKVYLELYGEDVGASKIATYIQQQEALKPLLEAQKKKLLSSTIYYNKRAQAPMLKKVVKKKGLLA